MNTIWTRAAAVSGARHLRMARNGQDAAASWVGDGAGAIVVCDGCGSSPSSEVGARLGAQLVIAALAARLQAGERPAALWTGVRTQVAAALRSLADAMPGGRAAAIREHFLFTIVAAAVRGDEACVWAIGDGAFACGDRVWTLGPFEDNQPPYLAYDLLD
ncbi:MAG: protein phosphatase 2C domain-containing protein, partial [bacterium]